MFKTLNIKSNCNYILNQTPIDKIIDTYLFQKFQIKNLCCKFIQLVFSF